MIIIANGMLRSGSTLQYNLAASIIEMKRLIKRVGFFGDITRPAIRAKLERMKASDSWYIIKTHEPPLEPEFYDERVRVLFSYRDVRDIAASIRKKWRYEFTAILLDIDKMIEIEKAFSGINNILFQPYETLYFNLPAATKEISLFLNTDISDADIALISYKLSAARLVEAKSANTRPLRGILSLGNRKGYNAHTLLHHDHVSSSGGRSGEWMTEFSEHEIAIMNERYSSWLGSYNYRSGRIAS